MELKTYSTFLFSRKVAKEHTAIQERYVPLGTTAFGTALGVGLREFVYLFSLCENHPFK